MNRTQKGPKRPQLLCVLGCEGENQERLYFQKIQELVNKTEKRTHDLSFLYAEPFGGDPKCVVERTITRSIGKTNKASVFDYDGKTSKYEEAIDLAMEHRIVLGYTNYCFDLWLLLHKENYIQAVSNQDGYANELRKAYGLKKGVNIKKKEQVEKIMEQINMEDVITAIARAESIAFHNLKKASHKTPQGYMYYDNPDTQIHNMLKLLFHKVGVSA
ncbi:MAG: RloB domain-containing protein [Lachnospiraceae bacterium]|nr:RloB domain-containing protein [Lachnospiraceae bacterium]